MLLPADPDASAERIRAGLRRIHGVDVAVIVNDSFGRAWRLGTVGTAIGVAGCPGLLDLRGSPTATGAPCALPKSALPMSWRRLRQY